MNLGWGDSAPDWYFRLQEIVFLFILLIGLIGWAVLYPRLDGFLTSIRSKKGSLLLSFSPEKRFRPGGNSHYNYFPFLFYRICFRAKGAHRIEPFAKVRIRHQEI